MVTINSKRDRIVVVRKQGPLKIADVEYRVLWNEDRHDWSILRNGAATGILARKKRTSAIDSAIRDAKVELATSEAVIMVTCLQNRKLQTIWKHPS